jgi:hypothetical protein
MLLNIQGTKPMFIFYFCLLLTMFFFEQLKDGKTSAHSRRWAKWPAWKTMSSRRISLVAPNAISHKNTPLSALDTESPAERRARQKAEQQQRATLRTAGGRPVQTFMNRRQAVIDLRQNNPDEFRGKVWKCSAHTGNACWLLPPFTLLLHTDRAGMTSSLSSPGAERMG